MSSVHKIVAKAIDVFKNNLKNPSIFLHSTALFAELEDLINDIELSDLNININEILNQQHFPVNYHEIFKNEDISIGIFFILHNCQISLHDHPDMYGIIKVLKGNARIKSFTPLEQYSHFPKEYLKSVESSLLEKIFKNYNPSKFLICERYNDLILNFEDKAGILQPKFGNIHEVSAPMGNVAFLDILSPPYDTPLQNKENGLRKCHFYKISDLLNNQIKDHKNENKVLMFEIPIPKELC